MHTRPESTHRLATPVWAAKACCLILLVTIGGCKDGGQPQDVRPHLASAESYLDQGQYNAAIIEARAALLIEPHNEAANTLLGRIYLDLGRPRQALELLQSIDGTTPEYHELLATAYLRRGKYASALLLVRQEGEHFDPVVAAVTRGDARMGLQDLDQAREEYQQALRLDPENLRGHLGVTLLDVLTGRLERAETQLNALLDRQGEVVEALTLLAGVYIRQGRMEEAEGALTRAIAALPSTDRFTADRVTVIRSMIELLAYQGRTGEALVYQQMLADAFPNAEDVKSRMSEVIIRLQAGELEAALALLDEIDAISPGNETTGTLRAIIAFLRGDDRAADDMFAQYVDPEIAGSNTLQMFAANQFRLNRPHRVVQILRERARSSRDPNLLALFGVAALSAGLEEDGKAALRRAADLAPRRVRLSIILAQALAEEEPEAALQELEHAFSIDPTDVVVRMALLDRYVKMNALQRASAFVDKLLAEYPEMASTHLVAGTYYRVSNQLDRAEAAFREAMRLEPKDASGAFGLAAVFTDKEQHEDAEKVYRGIIQASPDSFRAYTGLLDTYVARGRESDGVTALKDLAEQMDSDSPLVALSAWYASKEEDSQAEVYLAQARSEEQDRNWKRLNANLHTRRARRALIEGEFEEARRNTFSALASYPANRELLGLLTRIEIAAGNYGEAAKVLEQMGEIHPDARLFHILSGDLAEARGEVEAAVSAYEIAWEKQPGDQLGHKLYTAYRSAGRDQQASSFLETWRAAIPRSAVAVVDQAQALVGNGKLDAAIALYEEALRAQPNSHTLMNNLAWLYLEADRTEEAIETSEAAYRQTPRNGYIADTYGWALYKGDRAREAVAVLERATNLSSDPEIAAHLNAARDALSGTGNPGSP